VLVARYEYLRKVFQHIEVFLEIAEWPSYGVSINVSVRIESRSEEQVTAIQAQEAREPTARRATSVGEEA
jgi:hypothetical protein